MLTIDRISNGFVVGEVVGPFVPDDTDQTFYATVEDVIENLKPILARMGGLRVRGATPAAAPKTDAAASGKREKGGGGK